MAEKIVTRIAPSPTGLLHVGTARTTLFNWLFARHMGGTFLLRIEDTDRERSKREFEDNIMEGLRWLGLDWDGAMTRQSERGAIYRGYLERVIASGAAYVSTEEAEEGKRGEVIRLKNSGTSITFTDIVRGDITFDTKELGDFVIAKSLDEPLYHFAVVVDDHEMGVTHVIRGEDHISNTPRQILIQEAIGAQRPTYCHLPLILAPDRSKLSKRHGAVALTEYRDRGYLPDAMFNFLALLGWNPGQDRDREPLSRGEISALFSLERVQKSAGIFDIKKLDSLNAGYVKRHIVPESLLPDIAKLDLPLLNDPRAFAAHIIANTRSTVPATLAAMYQSGELGPYRVAPSLDTDKLNWKEETERVKTGARLKFVLDSLLAIEDWNTDTIKASIWEYAEKEGRGFVLWPMRYALTGLDKSPDPFSVAGFLGKPETLKRLKIAIQLLGE